jgi:hypothetical protein
LPSVASRAACPGDVLMLVLHCARHVSACPAVAWLQTQRAWFWSFSSCSLLSSKRRCSQPPQLAPRTYTSPRCLWLSLRLTPLSRILHHPCPQYQPNGKHARPLENHCPSGATPQPHPLTPRLPTALQPAGKLSP